MYKFSEIEKELIRNDALLAIKDDEYDAEDLHYVTEVFAARFLIKKFVGDDWFSRALNTTDFEKIKRSTKAEVPPISYYLGVQKTERHFKFIKFAMYLKFLAGNSNFADKKDEYLDEQKKRKSIISTKLFDSIYFELKIGAFFARNGLFVKFIKEGGDPTPDLEIKYDDDNKLLVECKKTRVVKFSIRNIEGVIERANKQLTEYGGHGLVAVELDEDANNSEYDEDELVKSIEEFIKEKPRIDFVMIANEFLQKINEKIDTLRTTKYLIKNPNPKYKIPQPILDVLIKSKNSHVTSLLDD